MVSVAGLFEGWVIVVFVVVDANNDITILK
jgi:hypothetical protein